MGSGLASTRRYTVDDLDQFPDDGKFRELVNGEIVAWDMPSWEHAALEAELTSIIRNFVRERLRAGVQLLWYVDPETGDTTVYQGDETSVVPADETLDGGDVLPGFQVRLGSVLQELREEME